MVLEVRLVPRRELPHRVRERAATGEQRVACALPRRQPGVHEAHEERADHEREDLTHAVAEEQRGALYAHLAVIFAVLARVDGVVDDRPTRGRRASVNGDTRTM